MGEEGEVGEAGFGKYLSLGEIQVHGDLVSPEPRQVVVVGEFGFQLPQLLLGEGRPFLPRPAARFRLAARVRGFWRTSTHVVSFVVMLICVNTCIAEA